MIPPSHLAGAVLAGGESRRMGSDKALLEVGGQPLWSRQVAILQAAGAAPIGVVRRSAQAALPLPSSAFLWLDSLVDVGPVAGLHAALQATSADWLAVAAVDLPRLDAGWFALLAAKCLPGRGAIVRHPDGTFEPLAAIYPASTRVTLSRQLERRDYSLQSLARALVAEDRLAVLPLPADGAARVENWNTPADRGLSAAG